MFLSEEQYDLVGKYASEDRIAFDAEELSFLYTLLNIELTEFREESLSEYVNKVRRETAEQDRTLTSLLGRFLILAERKSDVEAYRFLLGNIGRVKSLYMLRVLVSFVSNQQPIELDA